VVLKKFSAGRNRTEAIARAEKIKYNISYKDSVLDIGSGYAIDKSSKFRGQKVEIEIRVPVGKKINFSETVRRKLNSADVRVYRDGHWRNRGVDIDFDNEGDFPWNSNVDYTMGVDGELKDPSGNAAYRDYRYRSDEVNNTVISDSMAIEQQILDEKRKKEESEKRIEDLEKKRKEQQDGGNLPTPGTSKSRIDFKYKDEKGIAISTPSTMVSLVETWN
jgi:hypothetical protein